MDMEKEKRPTPIKPRTGKDVAELMASTAQIRKEQGLTQKQLAQRCGLSQAAISQLECGAVGPSLNHTFRLLRALGKTLKIVDLDE